MIWWWPSLFKICSKTFILKELEAVTCYHVIYLFFHIGISPCLESIELLQHLMLKITVFWLLYRVTA